MIKVKKSPNADTRTAEVNVTKDMLINDTISHMCDVESGCNLIAVKLLEAAENHDYTKLALIDKFYEDFSSRAEGVDFKSLGWFEQHLRERHHLNDRVPEDVNLIDVIEMIVDCCMAGMARSGGVNEIKIDNEVLQTALRNTVELIIKNIEVIDWVVYKWVMVG